MTVGEYTGMVRAKISDDVAPYRVTPLEVSNSLREALRRARQVRSSLAYKDGRLLAESDDVNFAATASTTVRVELDNYAEAIVFIAAARILANDNADTLNVGLSEKWRAQGTELLQI